MPGPLSSERSSTPSPSASAKRFSIRCPWPACFVRLVASSVATSATRPAFSSANPVFLACSPARRRAWPTWLGSATATITPFSPDRLPPTRQRYPGSLPHRGFDLELAAQPLRPAEPQPQPGPRCIPVGHRQLQIGDARPVVLKDQTQPT